MTQASSCHRARSTIAAADKPGRAIPQPFVALAVIGLGGDDQTRAHLAVGTQRGRQLVGQLPGDEHQRVDMMSRVVEHMHGDQPAGWFDRVGRTIVAATGNAMGELAVPTEAGQHIGNRQRGELTQLAHAESLQQFDELVVEAGHRRQAVAPATVPESRQWHRRRWHDHRATACCCLPCRDGGGEPAIGDAHPEPAHCGQALAQRGCLPAITLVARSVIRSAIACSPPKYRDGPLARNESMPGSVISTRGISAAIAVTTLLEPSGIAIGIVGNETHVRTARLGLAAALPDSDSFAPGRQRLSDHPVAMQHHDRFIERGLGGDDCPVRAPQHPEPRNCRPFHQPTFQVHRRKARHRIVRSRRIPVTCPDRRADFGA